MSLREFIKFMVFCGVFSSLLLFVGIGHIEWWQRPALEEARQLATAREPQPGSWAGSGDHVTWSHPNYGEVYITKENGNVRFSSDSVAAVNRAFREWEPQNRPHGQVMAFTADDVGHLSQDRRRVRRAEVLILPLDASGNSKKN